MIYVIAEIGLNHGGDHKLAEEMVSVAAEMGANGVKLQSFYADDLYFPGGEEYSIFKSVELSFEGHRKVREACRANKIDFLSTPFSTHWVDRLEELDTDGYKIASMDVNNPLLLKAVAAKKKRVILSTGGAELDEIRRAVDWLKEGGASSINVLHCISNYPAKPEDFSLSMIPRLKELLSLPVGLSDHSLGITMATAAVALGAVVIEKHFTLDRNLPGPDNAISADPQELSELVESVRMVELALAKHEIRADVAKKPIMRRGVYAGKDIRKGEVITLDNLALVRPEVTPLESLPSILNKPAIRDFTKGEPVTN